MPCSYQIPACMDANVVTGALSSLLGVLFVSCVSTLFLKLFNEEQDLAMVISFALLMLIIVFVAYAISNLYSDAPDLSIARNAAMFAIIGLVSVILIEYYSHVPHEGLKITVYLLTACALVAIVLCNIVSQRFKKGFLLGIRRVFCCDKTPEQNSGDKGDEKDLENPSPETVTSNTAAPAAIIPPTRHLNEGLLTGVEKQCSDF